MTSSIDVTPPSPGPVDYFRTNSHRSPTGGLPLKSPSNSDQPRRESDHPLPVGSASSWYLPTYHYHSRAAAGRVHASGDSNLPTTTTTTAIVPLLTTTIRSNNYFSINTTFLNSIQGVLHHGKISQDCHRRTRTLYCSNANWNIKIKIIFWDFSRNFV